MVASRIILSLPRHFHRKKGREARESPFNVIFFGKIFRNDDNHGSMAGMAFLLDLLYQKLKPVKVRSVPRAMKMK